jgi:hypothetical protein
MLRVGRVGPQTTSLLTPDSHCYWQQIPGFVAEISVGERSLLGFYGLITE